MLDGWNYVHVCLTMAKLHQNFHTTKKNPQNFLRIDGVEHVFEPYDFFFSASSASFLRFLSIKVSTHLSLDS